MFQKTILVFSLFFLAVHSAHATRCGNNVITEGDMSYKVRQQCGEPDLVDAWTVRVEKWQRDKEKGQGYAYSDNHELWTYNLGPNYLIRYFTFINNQLVDMESGSRGFSDSSSAVKARCGKRASVNDRKIDILRKCGKPTEKLKQRIVSDEVSSKNKGGGESVVTERVKETWIYDMGVSDVVYYIFFSNGVVDDINREGL